MPRDQRQELVGYLSGEGMSTRAIAPIVGAAKETVRADVEFISGGRNRPPAPAATVATGEGVGTGVPNGTPEAAPAPAATVATGEGVVNLTPAKGLRGGEFSPPERLPAPREGCLSFQDQSTVSADLVELAG